MEAVMNGLLRSVNQFGGQVGPVNRIVEVITKKIGPPAIAKACRGDYVCGTYCWGDCGGIIAPQQYQGYYLSDDFWQCDEGIYFPCDTQQCGCGG